MGLAASIQEYIANASRKFGVSGRYLTATAAIESGGDVNAISGSHMGLYQFSPTTAAEYGLTNPYDPQASANAAAQLARSNELGLVKALGRPVTDAEVYLAHQQGLGGAIKLLTGGDKSAASLVGKSAVTANGFNENISASAMVAGITAKFDRAAGENPFIAAGTSAPDEGAPDNSLVGYFIRGVVIITGFIFLAVGISMFRRKEKAPEIVVKLPEKDYPRSTKNVDVVLPNVDVTPERVNKEPPRSRVRADIKQKVSDIKKSDNARFDDILNKIVGITGQERPSTAQARRTSTDVTPSTPRQPIENVIDVESVDVVAPKRARGPALRKQLKARARKVAKQ